MEDKEKESEKKKILLLLLNRAFVCGALHWVAKRFDEGIVSNSVFAFDLVTEEHKMITLPDIDAKKVMVSELGGCLTCFTYDYERNEYREAECCQWVMKEYGIRESWIKLYTISINTTSVDLGWYLYPLACSENVDEVLLKSRGVFWYNLEKKTVRSSEVRLGEYSDVIICFESLVSLGGQAENDEDEEQDGEKRNESLSGKKRASVDH